MATEPKVAHPLFPALDDDDEPPEVEIIHIFRHENNQLVMVPKAFGPNEIVSEEQIYSLFGGGKYEIRSRGTLADGVRKGITAKRPLSLPGPSKPLFDAPEKPPEAPVVPIPGIAAVPPGGPTWLPILATFMPLLLAWLQNQQESARADRQSQQALLTAMMGQSQASNAQMITLLTTLKQPGGGSQEGFQEGMKFMQEFLAGQMERAQAEKEAKGEEQGIMQMINDISQAMDLVSKFSDASKSNPPMNNPAPVVETPAI